MENFIRFLEEVTTLHKLAWVFGCLLIVWIFEAIVPLFSIPYSKWRHDGINLVFFSFTAMINAAVGAVSIGIFYWIENDKIGILNWLDVSVWISLIVSVMALDFVGQYVAHYLLHKVKWMWKLHMVHHSDTHVDATTGTRHHPADYFLREIFGLATAVIVGIPVAFFVLYRLATVFFTYFTHANIQMPRKVDYLLSFIFITPNMHKFHHHFERPWTDRNYGNIFSFWDRIFGTYVYDEATKIKYGLDVLEGKPDQDIAYQLRIPFDKTIKTDY